MLFLHYHSKFPFKFDLNIFDNADNFEVQLKFSNDNVWISIENAMNVLTLS